VIRVFDEAGNVIETYNTRAISKSGKSLPPKRTREKETGDSPSPSEIARRPKRSVFNLYCRSLPREDLQLIYSDRGKSREQTQFFFIGRRAGTLPRKLFRVA